MSLKSAVEIKIKTIEDIKSMTRRIAYQIYEDNYQLSKLYLVGIAPTGKMFSEKLKNYLETISNLKIHFIELEMNKKNPTSKIVTTPKNYSVENQSIVIVDDVLNTGRTLSYAVNYFLSHRPDKIKTAILVNRSHNKFPIKADFKGVSLSTSTQEHIKVILTGQNQGIFLR